MADCSNGLSNQKIDEMTTYGQDFNTLIGKLIKKMKKYAKPSDMENVKRLSGLIALSWSNDECEIINKCTNKIWDNKDKIKMRDEKFFLTRTFDKYIKRDSYQQLIENLVKLIQLGFPQLPIDEKKEIWYISDLLVLLVSHNKALNGWNTSKINTYKKRVNIRNSMKIKSLHSEEEETYASDFYILLKETLSIVYKYYTQSNKGKKLLDNINELLDIFYIIDSGILLRQCKSYIWKIRNNIKERDDNIFTKNTFDIYANEITNNKKIIRIFNDFSIMIKELWPHMRKDDKNNMFEILSLSREIVAHYIVLKNKNKSTLKKYLEKTKNKPILARS